MSRSVLPAILEALETYLEQITSAFAAQAADRREPTLPATKSGKANGRAIAKALNLEPSQVQHLWNRPELRSAINAVAEEQGLKTLGAEGLANEVGAAAAARIRKTDRRSSELSILVAEQASTIERLRAENISLRERLRIFDETGQHLRLPGPRP